MLHYITTKLRNTVSQNKKCDTSIKSIMTPYKMPSNIEDQRHHTLFIILLLGSAKPMNDHVISHTTRGFSPS